MCSYIAVGNFLSLEDRETEVYFPIRKNDTEESGSNPVIGTEQIERGRSRHITWNVPAPVVLHINNL